MRLSKISMDKAKTSRRIGTCVSLSKGLRLSLQYQVSTTPTSYISDKNGYIKVLEDIAEERPLHGIMTLVLVVPPETLKSPRS